MEDEGAYEVDNEDEDEVLEEEVEKAEEVEEEVEDDEVEDEGVDAVDVEDEDEELEEDEEGEDGEDEEVEEDEEEENEEVEDDDVEEEECWHAASDAQSLSSQSVIPSLSSSIPFVQSVSIIETLLEETACANALSGLKAGRRRSAVVRLERERAGDRYPIFSNIYATVLDCRTCFSAAKGARENAVSAISLRERREATPTRFRSTASRWCFNSKSLVSSSVSTAAIC